jgi:hypothetical protein
MKKFRLISRFCENVCAVADAFKRLSVDLTNYE